MSQDATDTPAGDPPAGRSPENVAGPAQNEPTDNPGRAPAGHRRWLPNALTAGRILAAPVIAFALLATGAGGEPALYWATLALVLYVCAALTDWLDGALARAWETDSQLGAALDLWADKIMVGLTLLTLIHLHATGDADPRRLIPGAMNRPIEATGLILILTAITGRDIWVSLLRGRARQGGHRLAPSSLAKVKTAVVMTGLGVVIASIWVASLGPAPRVSLTVARAGYVMGWGLLAVGAFLSLWTAVGYWRMQGARKE